MKWWYRNNYIIRLLLPLSWLFGLLVKMRRYWLERHRQILSLPVVVVGNITVGGTGKTPLVIWLCHYLQKKGWRVGVVSRGYKSRASRFPKLLASTDSAQVVGDEPRLIANATHCPVVIDPDRHRAAAYLAASTDCNLIISDDGLQHYAMSRVMEIVTVDAERRFGNGYCLPIGPLREPISRLQEVDMVIGNGGSVDAKGYAMSLQPQPLCRVDGASKRMELADLQGKVVRAVTGIGHPQRFFDLLTRLGCQVLSSPFADHHQFIEDDFKFDKDEVLLVMTAKDAVKCQALAKSHWWYLPIVLKPNQAFIIDLDHKLDLIRLA